MRNLNCIKEGQEGLYKHGTGSTRPRGAGSSFIDFPLASSEIWGRGSFSTGVETQEIAIDRVYNRSWMTAIVG